MYDSCYNPDGLRQYTPLRSLEHVQQCLPVSCCLSMVMSEQPLFYI